MSDTGLALYIDGSRGVLSRFCPWPEVVEKTTEKRPADCSAIPKWNNAKMSRVAGQEPLNGSRIAKRGIVRPLDPSDPRNLSHASHREEWLELARALGRLEAREEYDLLHGNKESHPSDGIAKIKARDRN